MTTEATAFSEVLRQIGAGRGHLEAQEAMIAKLENAGGDTSDAQAVLSRLNEAQQLYIDELGRLEERLGSSNA
ncbi:hypothetical protein FPZ24_14565 [Sphingomonas panacisoli]|uniref:Uncharacterized protein n=1 Tax=Sphingomonas panacisoli TaxID=1813879 RepID=A0A5B8LN90_9SPHN|nr:hypothetical protein [Sphingomonas panacisoli]QDZ08540.1 hypothetical protein FPZ24_14565 [Sphingomonas panacisoli]